MEIWQRRNSNRIRYVFGEDALQYQWEDGSGCRSFSVPYTDISRDRQTLTERNAWLRNVGLLWLAIGAVTTAITWFDAGELKASIWLLIGAGCYVAYRLRSTGFKLVPSEKGNLRVIDGEDGRRILAEIESRRVAQFRREYDFMPEGELQLAIRRPMRH